MGKHETKAFNQYILMMFIYCIQDPQENYNIYIQDNFSFKVGDYTWKGQVNSTLMIQGCILISCMTEKKKRRVFCLQNKSISFSCFSQQMAPIKSMDGDENLTFVAMFVFLGLSDEKELQLVLFPIFLGIYLVTLTWNLGLICLIRMDSHLHIPMYFFSVSCLLLIYLTCLMSAKGCFQIS